MESQNEIRLFPAVSLRFIQLGHGVETFHHAAAPDWLEVTYCREGSLVWQMADGTQVFLHPGDISVHGMDICADSRLTVPEDEFSGASFQIWLEEPLLRAIDVLQPLEDVAERLKRNYCSGDVFFISACRRLERIFGEFFSQPDALKISWWRLKSLELLLALYRGDFTQKDSPTPYQSQLISLIREIHDYLIANLDRRVTIEDLAERFHVNATTLKNGFKSVYGTSLASHIREHRLETAAALLRSTDKSVAEIAEIVGYESQSKFTSAFKAAYQQPPTQFRKQRLNEDEARAADCACK